MSPLAISFEQAAKQLANKFLVPVIKVDPPAIHEQEIVFNIKDSIDFNSTGTKSDTFDSILDGAAVVKSFRNFTINAGHTVTTTNRCKGLYLNILGDLTINGTLSMTARGAKAVGKYVVIHRAGAAIWYCAAAPILIGPEKYTVIGPTGGAAQNTRYRPGNNGVNGACGGGASGSWTDNGGFGAAGTSFSGGAGGGAHYGLSGVGGNAVANGGAGGRGVRTSGGYGGVTCSGGAGNPGGAGSAAGLEGQSGTGGLLILFVKGNINIGPTGSIQSHGSNGGKTTGHADSRGGGGSGGGAIHIFHKGTINAPAKITATGGIGGLKPNGVTVDGRSGGKGTVNIVKI